MIGIMVLIVGAYIGILQREPASKVEETHTPIVTESLLETLPETPEEVIEIHNKLMKATYNSQTEEEKITDLVLDMRKLYSKAFLELNSEEDQKKALAEELTLNAENKMYLIDSKLEYIKYNEQENKAEAVVRHQTTKGDQKRVYYLIQEEGIWKILSWENLSATTASKTPEE